MDLKERSSVLDFIRVIATFLVVFNHAIVLIYNPNLDSMQWMSGQNKIFCVAGFTLGRIGVPLFLMLTGYLLLSRNYKEGDIKRFYRKKILPLFLVWELWIIFYQIYMCLFNQIPFDFLKYVRQALFLEHVEMIHAWYMPMIIGIYFFLPYISNALHKINGKILVVFLTVIYFYIFVVSDISMFQNAYPEFGDVSIGPKIDLSFSGNVYGFYLVLGYCIARYKSKIEKILKKGILFGAICLIGVIAYLVIIGIQLKLYSDGYEYNVWYNFLIMPLLGICVFMILFKVKMPDTIRNIQTSVAQCSFGVYLIHMMILEIIIKYVGPFTHRYLAVIGVSILTYVLALGLVEFISLVPHAGIIFLNISNRKT